MGREVKDMVIADIQSRIGDVKDFIVVDCSKVDAITANRWRLALRKQQMSALTVKNSVANNALKRKGIDGLTGVLSGPSTLVWGGDDIVALSRSVAKWAKEIKNFEIKGGTVEGESLDAAAVDALSKSAGRLETIGEIAGLMLAPGRQLAGCLQGPGGRLAGQLKTLSEEKQA
ncbi:MAG: 50S ribosomal protein L10 [Planctomycetota bacterium]|jgi:large subunit ribosomal protein L10|nr:MAG: 50S ribosomal protein L10 [Planctomycetota bacterium]